MAALVRKKKTHPLLPPPPEEKKGATRHIVYRLGLQDGYEYIGEVEMPDDEKLVDACLARRFKQHMEGKEGSAWTKLHAPINMLETWVNVDLTMELMVTLRRMADPAMGINKVRFKPSQRQQLEKLVAYVSGGCFQCGKRTHWVGNCPDLEESRAKQENKKNKRKKAGAGAGAAAAPVVEEKKNKAKKQKKQ